MTYQPTREEFELAALACGKEVINAPFSKVERGIGVRVGNFGYETWQPHLPTTQGKADLLDLIMERRLDVDWFHIVDWVLVCDASEINASGECVRSASAPIINGNKHAALMEAVIKVAALVGAKMKESAPC